MHLQSLLDLGRQLLDTLEPICPPQTLCDLHAHYGTDVGFYAAYDALVHARARGAARTDLAYLRLLLLLHRLDSPHTDLKLILSLFKRVLIERYTKAYGEPPTPAIRRQISSELHKYLAR